jgi:hypothetical protein
MHPTATVTSGQSIRTQIPLLATCTVAVIANTLHDCVYSTFRSGSKVREMRKNRLGYRQSARGVQGGGCAGQGRGQSIYRSPHIVIYTYRTTIRQGTCSAAGLLGWLAAAAGSYLPQQLLGCKDAHPPGVHARHNMLVWCACDVGGLRAVGSPPV